MALVNSVEMAPNGPHFSEFVQGYWRMNDWRRTVQEHLTFLKQHVALGITTVDHAHVYGQAPSCEELFGRVLKLDPGMRANIQIVSKCGIELVDEDSVQVNHYDSTPRAIENSVDLSLSRLGVDQLDVLLVHRPDWLMDVDAIGECFKNLTKSGKVSHFGVSNFTSSQFDLLQSRIDQRLVTNQVEINPVNFKVVDDGTLDQLQQYRVRPMAWSCLAGGRIFNEDSDRMSRLRTCLLEVAAEHGEYSLEQVVFAWIRKLSSRPVAILGSGNIDRVKSSLDSSHLQLNQEQWYRIWVASSGVNVP